MEVYSSASQSHESSPRRADDGLSLTLGPFWSSPAYRGFFHDLEVEDVDYQRRHLVAKGGDWYEGQSKVMPVDVSVYHHRRSGVPDSRGFRDPFALFALGFNFDRVTVRERSFTARYPLEGAQISNHPNQVQQGQAMVNQSLQDHPLAGFAMPLVDSLGTGHFKLDRPGREPSSFLLWGPYFEASLGYWHHDDGYPWMKNRLGIFKDMRVGARVHPSWVEDVEQGRQSFHWGIGPFVDITAFTWARSSQGYSAIRAVDVGLRSSAMVYVNSSRRSNNQFVQLNPLGLYLRGHWQIHPPYEHHQNKQPPWTPE